jgi:hypothetical protein
MKLLAAGVDLRRTVDGRWYCFEVNPSPGFTYYQDATGQPLAEAMAELLAEPGDDGKPMPDEISGSGGAYRLAVAIKS